MSVEKATFRFKLTFFRLSYRLAISSYVQQPGECEGGSGDSAIIYGPSFLGVTGKIKDVHVNSMCLTERGAHGLQMDNLVHGRCRYT